MSSCISANDFRWMIVAGANRLEANKQEVDELNVFPVPDGDTGTNMSLTVMSAAREVIKLGDAPTNTEVGKALSSGALRGARGNSGVILSQLVRGIYRSIKGKDDPIDAAAFAAAMRQGVETAYKAVMRPKEGTILTVARGMADAAKEAAPHVESVDELLRIAIEHGEEVLEQTPDMLPVLKEAGVVDAGGKGLLYIYKGMYASLTGEDTNHELLTEQAAKTAASASESQYTYQVCYRVHSLEPDKNVPVLRSYFSSIGDSIKIAAGEGVITAELRTNDPGLAMQKALAIGPITDVSVENKKPELIPKPVKQEEPAPAPAPQKPAEHKDFGFVAVSMGEGLTELLKDLGADQVISGGQTMNPSTEDVLNAVNAVNADCVYILPNNKNIILAANQAAVLIKDKKVLVVPTRNVPQGITALLNFTGEFSPEENLRNMEEMIQEVHTGMTTFAIRDSHLGEFSIHKDDILGMLDGELNQVGTDPEEVSRRLVDALLGYHKDLFTIYFGEDSTEESANKLADYIRSCSKGCEVEVHNGGQPLYHYIISVE